MDLVYRFILKGEEKKASEIEKECLDTAWSESQIASLPENAFYLVADCGDDLCGCASVYCVADEGQIMNIAVSEKYRKNGIGKGLMDKLEQECKKRNCQFISLEVAVDNIAAVALYKKSGYAEVGRRKGFYKGIDAIIMEKEL